MKTTSQVFDKNDVTFGEFGASLSIDKDHFI